LFYTSVRYITFPYLIQYIYIYIYRFDIKKFSLFYNLNFTYKKKSLKTSMNSLIKKIKNGKRLFNKIRKKLTKSSHVNEKLTSEICEECKCINCNAKRFKQNFKNWTS